MTPLLLSIDNRVAVASKRGRRETIGERVRRLREERGLTQRDLEVPGVSYAYISRIEKDARRPSLKAIRLLADRLGVTPEHLETGEPVPPPVQREWRLSDAELEVRADGNLDKAHVVFVREAQAAADARSVARARAGLGLIAARRNDPKAAIAHLEAATESGQLSAETRPDVYAALGEMYVAIDQAVRAVVLFEDCLQMVRERAPEDATLQARFAVYLAAAHGSVGAIEGARRALAEATDAAEEWPTPLSRVRVYWMRSIDAWQEADSDTALTYIRRAIGLLEAEDNTLQLARAHVVAGRMLTLDARDDEADVHLQRARRLFAVGGTPVDLGILCGEEAKIAARRGDVQTALALAQQAAERLGDDARYRANVSHAYAVAHAASGELPEAETRYREALDALRDARQWREAAQVARELSQLLRTLNREAEAFDLIDEASLLMLRHVGGVRRSVRERR